MARSLRQSKILEIISTKEIETQDDLVAQLKAIKTKEIDISYGDSAIVINSGNLKQLIPENKVERV